MIFSKQIDFNEIMSAHHVNFRLQTINSNTVHRWWNVKYALMSPCHFVEPPEMSIKGDNDILISRELHDDRWRAMKVYLNRYNYAEKAWSFFWHSLLVNINQQLTTRKVNPSIKAIPETIDFHLFKLKNLVKLSLPCVFYPLGIQKSIWTRFALIFNLPRCHQFLIIQIWLNV